MRKTSRWNRWRALRVRLTSLLTKFVGIRPSSAVDVVVKYSWSGSSRVNHYAVFISACWEFWLLKASPQIRGCDDKTRLVLRRDLEIAPPQEKVLTLSLS
jgi:hypothetical protein